MKSKKSLFQQLADIVPPPFSKGMSVTDIIDAMGQTCFEARNLFRGAMLYKRMVDEGDTIWMGIAGAGIAGGMGGMVSSLMEAGCIDVICSTGAQVYHDLHFAFGLPVKAISPFCDDNALRNHGDTRIYDIGIREKETLEAQDRIIRTFVRECYRESFLKASIASWEFNYALGRWVNQKAPFPERSFIACAARQNIPVFWDSLANHSIAMNLVATDREGYPIQFSAQKDVWDSAAIVYSANQTGFVELGGGGPKNFIQQTGPTISQILKKEYEGAERGLQIGTAVEKEGSLSSCTFGESVTWGKYRSDNEEKLVQIWSEYSLVFPILSAFLLENCEKRPSKQLIPRMNLFADKLGDGE